MFESLKELYEHYREAHQKLSNLMNERGKLASEINRMKWKVFNFNTELEDPLPLRQEFDELLLKRDAIKKESVKLQVIVNDKREKLLRLLEKSETEQINQVLINIEELNKGVDTVWRLHMQHEEDISIRQEITELKRRLADLRGRLADKRQILRNIDNDILPTVYLDKMVSV